MHTTFFLCTLPVFFCVHDLFSSVHITSFRLCTLPVFVLVHFLLCIVWFLVYTLQSFFCVFLFSYVLTFPLCALPIFFCVLPILLLVYVLASFSRVLPVFLFAHYYFFCAHSLSICFIRFLHILSLLRRIFLFPSLCITSLLLNLKCTNIDKHNTAVYTTILPKQLHTS